MQVNVMSSGASRTTQTGDARIIHDNPRLGRNNFDLLRLLFAMTVCLVHAYILSGIPQLRWLSATLSSKVAVEAFFVVSGFLIFMSYERSSSVTSYASKRIRRIYPAYFTIVMMSALLLSIISTVGLGDYLSVDWLKYLVANLTFMNFLHQALPGVFEGNKLDAVNGALWTLKIEVMFYAAVPIIVFLFRRLGHLPVMAALYVSSLAYAMLLTSLAHKTGSGMYTELARQLPGQLSYFMAGAFLYYFLPLFERRLPYFIAFSAMTLLAGSFYPATFLEPLALAIAVVFFGLYFHLGNFGKYGDFSYGVYIIHFPVIQVIVQMGWFKSAPSYYLAAVVLITLTGAIAMWHLVEKRFLFRSSHYIEATQTEHSR